MIKYIKEDQKYTFSFEENGYYRIYIFATETKARAKGFDEGWGGELKGRIVGGEDIFVTYDIENGLTISR